MIKKEHPKCLLSIHNSLTRQMFSMIGNSTKQKMKAEHMFWLIDHTKVCLQQQKGYLAIKRFKHNIKYLILNKLCVNIPNYATKYDTLNKTHLRHSRYEREPDAERLCTVIEHPSIWSILRFLDPRYLDGDGET